MTSGPRWVDLATLARLLKIKQAEAKLSQLEQRLVQLPNRRERQWHYIPPARVGRPQPITCAQVGDEFGLWRVVALLGRQRLTVECGGCDRRFERHVSSVKRTTGCKSCVWRDIWRQRKR